MVAQVVDELVTTLTLDTEPYEKAEARAERATDRTFRKQQERARITERTNKDQQRRLGDVAKGVKSFATQVTAAVGIVTGLGAAVVGTMTGFLGFETALRRQAVGTQLSNKQMQAWGATMRRLGGDADAGAAAIANLAREQREGLLTGNAPTLMALSRMGVNVDPSRNIQDILGDAQAAYRAAPTGQRQQMESSLSAQGVSPDLILAIKSERDVREVFTQSLSQATEENRKALDALADALESAKASSISIAATLVEALQPQIEAAADKLKALATDVAQFAQDVRAAGGGVDGFQIALDRNVPMLGRLFEGFRMEAEILSGAAQLVIGAFRKFLGLIPGGLAMLNRIRAPWGDKGLVDDIRDRVRSATGTPDGLSVGQRIALAIDNTVRTSVANARAYNTPDASPSNPNPSNLPRNVENDLPAGPVRGNVENDLPAGPVRGKVENDLPAGPVRGKVDAQSLMNRMITQYGLNAQQAAGVVANLQRESGLNTAAYNGAGGGTGARGLAQWRGARSAAFKARYGVMPNQATVEQQIEFMFSDPYERQLMQKAMANGSTASEYGVAFSRIFEAHGNPAEDARRGRLAASLVAGSQGPATGANTGTTINVARVEVNANNPAEFANGMQRLDGSQSYNTVVR